MKFLVLGSHPELSRAEIESVTGTLPTLASKEAVLLETDQDASALQERLGGISKVGEIVATLDAEDSDILALAETLSRHMLSNRTETGQDGAGKLYLGLSVYDGGDTALANRLARDRQKIGLTVKKSLKEQGHSVRYVDSKERALSSVIVTTNRLLRGTGGEYVLIAAPNALYLGRTEAVQDFKAWSDRDYGRPARDAKSGMLPPKLARMMVNLGGDGENQTLLDPFCGSGTVLMEGLLLGYKVIGSDISKKAVEDTRENIEWIASLPGFAELLAMTEIKQSPAADLTLDGPVDLIVTETYLGVPLYGRETAAQLQKAMAELMKLYEPSFRNLHALLKPGGKAVVAFPAFRKDQELMHLPLKPMLEGLGFAVERTFLYEREGQKVAREILVMRS